MIKAIYSIIIWPIWALMFLISAMVYTIGLLFLPSKKLHPLARIVGWMGMFFAGQWLRLEGPKPLLSKGPYLYLINHASLFDAFMAVTGIPHYFTGVGAVEQFSYPVWGFLAKKYGLIPLERSKRDSAIGSMDKLQDALRLGMSALIAPEGTRTLTGNLGEFKKGAFHLAKNTGITIIPIGLKEAYIANNKNDWRLKPGILSAIFGEPIQKKDYNHLSVDQLRDLVKSKIINML